MVQQSGLATSVVYHELATVHKGVYVVLNCHMLYCNITYTTPTISSYFGRWVFHPAKSNYRYLSIWRVWRANMMLDIFLGLLSIWVLLLITSFFWSWYQFYKFLKDSWLSGASSPLLFFIYYYHACVLLLSSVPASVCEQVHLACMIGSACSTDMCRCGTASWNHRKRRANASLCAPGGTLVPRFRVNQNRVL